MDIMSHYARRRAQH